MRSRPSFRRAERLLKRRLACVLRSGLNKSNNFSQKVCRAIGTRGDTCILLLSSSTVARPRTVLETLRFSSCTAEPILINNKVLRLSGEAMLCSSNRHFSTDSTVPTPTANARCGRSFTMGPLESAPRLRGEVGPSFGN